MLKVKTAVIQLPSINDPLVAPERVERLWNKMIEGIDVVPIKDYFITYIMISDFSFVEPSLNGYESTMKLDEDGPEIPHKTMGYMEWIDIMTNPNRIEEANLYLESAFK